MIIKFIIRFFFLHLTMIKILQISAYFLRKKRLKEIAEKNQGHFSSWDDVLEKNLIEHFQHSILESTDSVDRSLVRSSKFDNKNEFCFSFMKRTRPSFRLICTNYVDFRRSNSMICISLSFCVVCFSFELNDFVYLNALSMSKLLSLFIEERERARARWAEMEKTTIK